MSSTPPTSSGVDPTPAPSATPSASTESTGASPSPAAPTGATPSSTTATAAAGADSAALLQQALSVLSSMVDVQEKVIGQNTSLTESITKISQGVAGQAVFGTTQEGAHDPFENGRKHEDFYQQLVSVALEGHRDFVQDMSVGRKLLLRQLDVSWSAQMRLPSAGDSVPSSQTAPTAAAGGAAAATAVKAA